MTDRAPLVEAAILFEESRKRHEAVAADPNASPEQRFFARHEQFIREVELNLAAGEVLRQSLH